MPAKRVQKRKKSLPDSSKTKKRSSVVISANAANSADIHAELSKLLAGEAFSQSGYVLVTVDPTKFSQNGTESGSSQDPLNGTKSGTSQDPLDSEQKQESEGEQESDDEEEQETHGKQGIPDEATECPQDHGPDQVPVLVAKVEQQPDAQQQEVDDEADGHRSNENGSEALNFHHELSPDSHKNVSMEEKSSGNTQNAEEPLAVEGNEHAIEHGAEIEDIAVEVLEEVQIDADDEAENLVLPVNVPVLQVAPLAELNKKSAEVRKLKKTVSAQEHEIVVLKDTILFLTQENQELKNKKQIPSIKFTEEPDIDISLKEIENVDSTSGSDSLFVANLAIHFYGTDRLKNMSTTGQPTPRFKNKLKDDGTLLYPGREQIEPKIFKFICEKLTERVAQRLGPLKVKEIGYFANEQIVRKYIAQKISNLNKADARRRE